MHSSMLGESSLRHSIPNQHANIDAEDYTLSLLSKPLIALACLHVADRSVGRSVGGWGGSAAIGYYMIAAKRLQPSIGVVGFNPSIDMRQRVSTRPLTIPKCMPSDQLL